MADMDRTIFIQFMENLVSTGFSKGPNRKQALPAAPLGPSQKCHKAEIARCTSFDQWMDVCFQTL